MHSGVGFAAVCPWSRIISAPHGRACSSREGLGNGRADAGRHGTIGSGRTCDIRGRAVRHILMYEVELAALNAPAVRCSAALHLHLS